jgi:hypothetical protein
MNFLFKNYNFQNCISCGLYPLVKENLELKYFLSKSTFLTLANKALSTATYSVYLTLFLSSSFFFSS